MILKSLCIANLYTYKLNLFAMVKGILFYYGLLTSMCIQAVLDNNISESINIDKEEDGWFFMYATNSNESLHIKETCYIGMIDKEIQEDSHVNKKICDIIIALQDNNVEEIPNINKYQSLEFRSIGNLSRVEIDGFLRVLNSTQKVYQYALVVIFTINGKDKKLNFNIEKIDLNRTVVPQDIMINSSCSELYILNPIFASCKRMRPVSKHSPHNNNAGYKEMLDMDMLLDYFDNNTGIDILNHQLESCEDTVCDKMPDISVDALLDCCDDDQESDISNADDNIGIESKNNSVESSGIQNKKDILSCGMVINIDNTERPSGKSYECDNRHMLTYTNNKEKPFKCIWPECSNNFAHRGNFNTHMKLHRNKMDYKCAECGKEFVTLQGLNRHIPIHAESKPFKCDICRQSFVQKQQLFGHIMRHLGEKPFKCDTCSKRFVRKDYLKVHLRIHESGNKVKCHLCRKEFTRTNQLTLHLSTHTNEKNFKCDICNKEFARRDYLRRHLLRHARWVKFK
ncbi:MAG: C2H2-type zinc finger protein [Candidatus Endonucleobacter bathymodioli]|uniref:C2H2-type zinc finger protein n=1 Tax=Candidatus Endonucleibacter bathymodioli TaxID=539814 RepID=A0AA90NKN1_9GAMM|nr:C2H2-type zinc finger protein [Candidatus Endonucleobacter bathymodioli]